MRLGRLTILLCCLSLITGMAGCEATGDPSENTSPLPGATATAPATPSTNVLQVRSIATEGAQLRVVLPSVKISSANSRQDIQLFVVMADPAGIYTYLLNPANRRGEPSGQFDLSAFPLEISLDATTETIMLWILALHNVQYRPAELFGIDALAASLGIGFRNWLNTGDPTDDPLAAIVAASNGALFDWFANIEVIGQTLVLLQPDDDGAWPVGLSSQTSSDNAINAVLDVQYIPADQVTVLATPSPATAAEPRLMVDETFPGGYSSHQWFENQDSTYINRLTNGAYEIQLTAIEQGESGLSWGSMEGERFQNYRLEARVRLVEDDVIDGRYGIWFHYQDDYNFVYFGVRNTGEYRVAIIQRDSSRIEIQDWTPHEAIVPGAAANVLAIEASEDGTIALSINATEVKRFTDSTFTSGSVAFFCYAASVPTTCRLERLRLWDITPS